MLKFSNVVLVIGGISLVSPVMANDDYDGGDYEAAPAALTAQPAEQSVPVVKKAAKPIRQYYSDLTGLDADNNDDGDYAAAPIAQKAPVAPPQKADVVKSKAKVPGVAKIDAEKLASAKYYAAQSKWNSRPTVDPFE